MRKIVLFSFLLLLNGCSLSHLFVGGEIDKVTVVGYEPYMKHHRAYFSRTQLKTIKNNKKYLYLYNAKTNDVGVLLYRKNQFVLYNMSDPEKKPFAINVNSKQKYQQALKAFKRKGFKYIKSLASVGHTASSSHRRYKGIKTILIETKKYSRLQSLYQKAIKNYDASKVKHINTTLPKVLISSYYSKYKKYAKTRPQLLQLKIIADKLDLNAPIIPKKELQKKALAPKKNPKITKQKSVPKKESKVSTEIPKKEEKTIEPPKEKPVIQHTLPKKVSSAKSYRYYLKRAPLSELSNHIAKRETRNTLSSTQYHKLIRRKAKLEERRLVKHGSLEELIAAYKVNKKATYKRRIMSLMKAKQTQD